MNNANSSDLLLLLFVLMFSVAIGFIIHANGNMHKQYPLTTTIVEIDKANDIVVCEDFNGNLWEFVGVEDWMIGDICSMIMSDKGTDIIYDDEILDVRYGGYIER